MTLTPGIHDLAADDYHADGIHDDTPTLSAGIANLIVTRSPRHAWNAHPKLNPDHERIEDPKFDLGTSAHSLLLQGFSAIEVIEAENWRTTAAKEAAAEARSNGLIPLLPEQANTVLAMVGAARDQLAVHLAEPTPFTDGKPEQTLVWEDIGGVICRSRLDWLRDDHLTIDDYKTTSASADPRKWAKTMYGIGADVQVAFYLRGCQKLFGEKPVWRYVVQETYPPYALSVVDLAPSALAVADDKVACAIDLWARCLRDDSWPAYDERVASIEVPTWAEIDWLERAQEAAA